MNKEIKTYILLAIIVILIIIGIFTYRAITNQENIDKETLSCIANKSIVYSSSICEACKYQKDILGEDYKSFQEIDCFSDEEKQLCIDTNISRTPTWVINNTQFIGVKTLKELKELTGC